MLITAILSEFINWIKIIARKKYGAAGPSNPRLDYVLNFLDGLEADIEGFINHDFKAPEGEVTIDKLRKKN